MKVKGREIIFNYDGEQAIKDSVKGFWFGIIMFIFVLIGEIGIAVLLKMTLRESLMFALKCTGLISPLPICFLVVNLINRNKAKKGLYISVSPSGVTDAKGKVIPIEDIAHCYLQYSYSDDSGLQADTPASALVVVFRTKKRSKSIKLNYFDAPVYNEGHGFHITANNILGINLFTKFQTLVHHYKGE